MHGQQGSVAQAGQGSARRGEGQDCAFSRQIFMDQIFPVSLGHAYYSVYSYGYPCEKQNAFAIEGQKFISATCYLVSTLSQEEQRNFKGCGQNREENWQKKSIQVTEVSFHPFSKLNTSYLHTSECLQNHFLSFSPQNHNKNTPLQLGENKQPS